jgi:hypothetical protein
VALKVVGSNPTNHPVNTIVFFKKKKIKRKQLRKKTHLLPKLPNVLVAKSLKKVYKNLNFYKKYKTSPNLILGTKREGPNKKNPMIISISQKKSNPKCTIHKKKNINTFSVGSIVKYFKIKQSKYIRRSLKGLKIFLNFIKTVLEKFYLKEGDKCIVFNLSGIDYNLISLKKNIKTIIRSNNISELLFFSNLRVSFTKKKE